MSSSDFPDEIRRDEDLLDAISRDHDAGHGDDLAGELLGQLARATAIDYTDEAAVQAVILAAAAQMPTDPSAIHGPAASSGGMATWVAQHRRLIIVAVAMAVAAVVGMAIFAMCQDAGAPGGAPAATPSTNSGRKGGVESSPQSTHSRLPAQDVGASGPSPSFPTQPLSAPHWSRPAYPAVPSQETTTPTTSTSPSAPLLLPTFPGTPSATSGPVASPSTTSTPTSPSPTTCTTGPARLSGSTATVARVNATTVTLTWSDPFGAGDSNNDLVLAYTLHKADASTAIAPVSMSFNRGTIGGQDGGALQVTLDATRATHTTSGVDIQLAFTYRGQTMSVHDGRFVIADIDGPYSSAGDLGAESVSISGPGGGNAINPRYLAGAGTDEKPWQRRDPSSPDISDVTSASTDGAVRVQLPNAYSTTVRFRVTEDTSRSRYSIWLTPPTFVVTNPACS